MAPSCAHERVGCGKSEPLPRACLGWPDLAIIPQVWTVRDSSSFELVITANKPAPEIPVGGALELLS